MGRLNVTDADQLSGLYGGCYSAMMSDRKDLRRIVLLAREYRKVTGIRFFEKGVIV